VKIFRNILQVHSIPMRNNSFRRETKLLFPCENIDMAVTFLDSCYFRSFEIFE